MSKIAIIVQRYGLEVNGGAEYHARILAEQLAKKHKTTVLTTKAIDYISWENHYSSDIETINNITVKRFKTEHNRLFQKTGKTRRTILKEKKYQRVLLKTKLFNYLDKKTSLLGPTKKQSYKWLKAQGPYCPDILTYIKDNKDNYDCFIFFTYLYYPSTLGLPLVKEKSILIPTAHNEPEFFSETYKNIFQSAKFIMYNTLAEKKMVENHIKNLSPFSDVAGIGITPFSALKKGVNNTYFDEGYKFLLYVGRIDNNKGCDFLYDVFLKFKKDNPTQKIKLIFVGKNHTDLKPTEDIIFTGFVDENTKYDLIKKSSAVVLPSKFESLSMVTLEAMNEGKIMLVNGQCEVLKDHIINSNSGYSYKNSDDFIMLLHKILHLNNDEIERHGSNAKNYVEKNYTWEKIIEKFDQAIQIIKDNN